MAGNIARATVKLRGTRSLLFSRFGEDSIPLNGPGERTGVAGNDPEEWRRRLFVTSKGQLYLEPTYLFACIREGARFVPKKGLTNFVSATLMVDDERLMLPLFMPGPNNPYDVRTAPPPPRDIDAPVYLDVRGVVLKATKSHNVRYRVAASPGWELTAHLTWDVSVVNRDLMKSAIIEGGRLSGLGDGRKIGFGRFEVVDYDVAVA